MTDKDGNVREAAADVVAGLAKNYLEVKGQPLPQQHPVLQIAQDTIVAQSQTLSFAGGAALSKMAPFVGPLDHDTLKGFLRLLTMDQFQSKAFVLQALASWDPEKERASGFITRGLAGIQPGLGAVVGMQKTDSKAGESVTMP
jgi:hypothetical protein